MKNLRTAFFGVVMLCYLAYPYFMIRGQEHILERGTSYRFKPRPVDPVDAFRGKYIVLNYNDNTLNYPNAEEIFSYGQKVFLSIAKDDQGFAYFSAIHPNRPDSGDYILTTCWNVNKNKVRIQLPENMKRYFLNEKIAPEAERVYRQLINQNTAIDSVFVYVDTRVYNGNILLEKVYFKNQPVEEYIRSLSASTPMKE